MCLARHMNVGPEPAEILDMKNEFYLSRIIFTDAKKRYVSNSILQEGVLLNGGLGKVDLLNQLSPHNKIFRIIENLKWLPIGYLNLNDYRKLIRSE